MPNRIHRHASPPTRRGASGTPPGARQRPVLLTVLVVTLAGPDAAHAGAWVTPPDEGYVKVAAGFTSTRDRHDFEGERKRMEGIRFSEATAALYGAMGLVRRVELNLATTIKRSELDGLDGFVETSGLGDLGVGVKLGIFERPYIQSLELRVKLPTGYDDERNPPLGDGQIDLEGRVLCGASLWSIGLPAYLGLEGGYRHREGTPGDELFFLAEAGANVTHDFGVRTKLDGSYARDIPRDDEAATDLFALHKRVTRIDGALWFEIVRRTYIEVGFVRVLSARNLTGGNSWNVGIARKLDLGR